MGWSIATRPETSAEHVAHILKEWESDRHTIIAHQKVGKTLWVVVGIHADGKDKPETDRIIVCVLREKYDGCWGEKTVSEDMGPYEHSCPLKFLKLQPKDHGGMAQAWRERVKAYHAQAKFKPAVGDFYKIGLRIFKIISTKPRRVMTEKGEVFSYRPRQVSNENKVEGF
jgi:hypothetical protein